MARLEQPVSTHVEPETRSAQPEVVAQLGGGVGHVLDHVGHPGGGQALTQGADQIRVPVLVSADAGDARVPLAGR